MMESSQNCSGILSGLNEAFIQFKSMHLTYYKYAMGLRFQPHNVGLLNSIYLPCIFVIVEVYTMV